MTTGSEPSRPPPGIALRSLRFLLNRTPSDASSEAGRAIERHRRIVLTALASLAARSVNVLTVVVSVPLTMRYLGTERYGLWMTISSIATLLSFADLGLGNGLVNGIADASGKGDKARIAEYVSSAFFLLVGIATIIALAFFLTYPWLPWQTIFNLTSPVAIAEAGPAVGAFVVCLLIAIPLGIVDRVLIGHQEGFMTGLWGMVGNVAGLVAVLAVIRVEGGLPSLVLAMSGCPLVATAINGALLFTRRRPYLLPKLASVRRDAVRLLFRLGMLFLAMQIAAAIAWGVDNLVIAHIQGQPAVAEYSATRRLFAIVPMMLSMLLAPLWPAYGEAIARADLAWVGRTLRRSVALAFFSTAIACVALALAGKTIMAVWVGGAANPSWSLLASLAVLTTLGQTGSALNTFLTGAGALRSQAVLGILMACFNLPISIYLTRRLGASGVVWGSVVAATLFSWGPMLVYAPIVLRRMHQRANPPRSPQ